MELFISCFNRLAADTLRNYAVDLAQPVTLIYGPAGVGKTELLRKIYHQSKKPQVLLIDALTFSQNYALAAQEGSLNDFRQHVRSHKLILLDRVEILKGKKKTLEELLHTLDALVSHGGKLVVSFQGEPHQLSYLGPKLSSRFLGGMTLPINAPTHNELADYANRYARSRFLILPEPILQSIADRTLNLREVQEVIRDFEVYLNNDAEKMIDEPTMACWESFLQDRMKSKEEELTPDNILRIISELTGVLAKDIRGNSRSSAPLAARRFAVYALRNLYGWSYPQLGEYFGKSHSVMMKSSKVFEETIQKDQKWKSKFEILQGYFD
ncbi:DnaA ATPase domain-containing protein [Desulfitobacterium sp.]|uniref:DnaA/Hda family protein n=1 Tax=Desulfitobacterium sp. TaxID=49981 RepID=UPI002B1F5D03|nr:DnaA/Hda family protein [Desulfitobacterium sp.]MEA4902818.1 DnaA/Hda family protein [Desulfitobacterium sp.]